VLNAVQNKVDLVHLVFDNKSIAMTGHQDSASCSVDYSQLIQALGVTSFTEAHAFEPKALQAIIETKLRQKGVHVIWISGTCARIPDARSRFRQATFSPKIDSKKCGSCTLCYDQLACPAILKNAQNEFHIELSRCMRCGVCVEICPADAIDLQAKTIAP
jgi:indolepyruvate ferredoxin oxidoreductase alpha subunit